MLSDSHVNIRRHVVDEQERITKLRFTFELADITHLSRVLTAVKKVEGVYDAYRGPRWRP